MSELKKKNFFVSGAISPAFVAESIQKHQDKTEIGGHSIFLGQVRKDRVGEQQVTAIDFSAYEAMANEKIQELKEALFTRYEISCLHVYHSLGLVKTGEICIFVFVSAPHRKAAIQACDELVDSIKKDVPIFGKELFENNTHQWKKNKTDD